MEYGPCENVGRVYLNRIFFSPFAARVFTDLLFELRCLVVQLCELPGFHRRERGAR